jgi:transcription initiation factor IIF auxiliary subunit
MFQAANYINEVEDKEKLRIKKKRVKIIFLQKKKKIKSKIKSKIIYKLDIIL